MCTEYVCYFVKSVKELFFFIKFLDHNQLGSGLIQAVHSEISSGMGVAGVHMVLGSKPSLLFAESKYEHLSLP